MGKLYLTFIFILLNFNSFSNDGMYWCFVCDNNPNLKISLRFKNGSPYSVKYAGQKEEIKIKLFKEEEYTGGAHPMNVMYYNEIFNGKVTGIYQITFNGAFNYLKYTRKKDGKVFEFDMDNESSTINETYRKTPCY